jgi:hypothetical protein
MIAQINDGEQPNPNQRAITARTGLSLGAVNRGLADLERVGILIPSRESLTSSDGEPQARRCVLDLASLALNPSELLSPPRKQPRRVRTASQEATPAVYAPSHPAGADMSDRKRAYGRKLCDDVFQRIAATTGTPQALWRAVTRGVYHVAGYSESCSIDPAVIEEMGVEAARANGYICRKRPERRVRQMIQRSIKKGLAAPLEPRFARQRGLTSVPFMERRRGNA